MFKQRSQQPELMDDITLATPMLAKNLQEIAITNRLFGARRVLLQALDTINKKYDHEFSKRTITIADLGCGGGDLLANMDSWAIQKKLAVEFIGVDVNSFMVQQTKKNIKNGNPTVYRVGSILDQQFINSLNMDVACLNSITHHFTDTEMIKLLQDLKQKVNYAIIINDLRRHWFSYYAIKFITKIFRSSYLTQHDAPLSVLRAFREEELRSVLSAAGISSFQIKRAWAFRWQIIVWCT